MVISPWSRSGVDDNYYSQIDVVRTVEQILGIKPMNQEDHSAVPMYGAFKRKPNFAPYNVLPESIPLTLGVPGYGSTLVKQAGARAAALASAEAVPASQVRTYEAWMAWSKGQHFVGRHAIEDYAKPAMLNRLAWVRGSRLAARVPRRRADLSARSGPRPEPAGRLPRRRLASISRMGG